MEKEVNGLDFWEKMPPGNRWIIIACAGAAILAGAYILRGGTDDNYNVSGRFQSTREELHDAADSAGRISASVDRSAAVADSIGRGLDHAAAITDQLQGENSAAADRADSAARNIEAAVERIDIAQERIRNAAAAADQSRAIFECYRKSISEGEKNQ